MEWKIENFGKKDLKGAILISGLPGIGNVGKIVVDFLKDELKAELVCEFFSYHMPHSVFVQEDNLIEMPKIELYLAKKGKTKILLLTGDAQPVDEQSTYSLCDKILEFFHDNKGDHLITLGGIGLKGIPKKPKVYITGNDKKLVKEYAKDTEIKTKIFGVVGPIIGVSGLLLGLAKRRKIKAVSLLAQTLRHPMFLGLKGSRELLKILNKKLNLEVDLKNLEKEIDEFESKMKLTKDLGKVSKKEKKDMNYIG